MTGQQATPLSMDLPDTSMGATDQRVEHAPPPRAATTPNNITAPNVIRQMPLIHQRHTCNNNPFQILASNDDDYNNTMAASNCSPHVPTPNLPASDLPRNQPSCQWTRQIANQPTNPPTTLRSSRLGLILGGSLFYTSRVTFNIRSSTMSLTALLFC